MTCKVYGNVGHLGNDCPKTHEEAQYINNGYRQQGGGNNNGWSNQPHLPFQGNSNYNSNFNLNDKILENINSKIEALSSSIKNQLSFNKMIETKIAQIVATIPSDNNGKILGQPINSLENINTVTTRGVNPLVIHQILTI
jgi:hypothetical protein